MNNKSLLEKIKKFNGETFNLKEELLIRELTTNLQFADNNTLVSYTLRTEGSEELLKERMSGVEPGLLVLNRSPKIELNIAYAVIPLNKQDDFFSEVIEEVYPLDSNSFSVIGITGTNGKSTCVSLCEQVSLALGLRAASLGTVGITINGTPRDLKITGTTPSFLDLRRIINSIKNEVDFLFMEVSSHAISQGRLGNLKLHSAGWTSFSQDHLDYHGSMEEYFEAKANIITKLANEESKVVIPAAQKEIFSKLEGFSKKMKFKNPLIKATTLERLGFDDLPQFFKVHYNKENLELSLELVSQFVDVKKLDISKLKAPKGRFSIIEVSGGFAVIDYAHTPDAIENLVGATLKAFPDSRVITLFGCGGDRDRSKRPLMAKAAESLSHDVIVTSDNPRSEDPDEIISDIVKGLSKTPLLIEKDRCKAIHAGIKKLTKGDVLIIAGKGHEEYQEINGKKIFFSDFAVVEDIRKSDD